MAQYPWKNLETGEVINLSASMKNPPKIGARKKIKGVMHERILPTGYQLDADLKNKVSGYPYESQSIEPGWKGCERGPRGGAIIKSRQHEREITAQSKDRPGGTWERD